MYFVYMLECVDASVYTGWTVSLEKRVAQHNLGKGAKYTRSRLPVKLLCSWEFASSKEARQFEAHCKTLTRSQKFLLMADHNSQVGDQNSQSGDHNS
jgi:putative endonuclease